MGKSHTNPPRVDESAFSGQWLALNPVTHEVVADGETLEAAARKAAERGVADPLFHPVPESDGYFIGAA